MKQPLNLILTLMALCIGGIIGLQLFWNYQNYQAIVKSFQYEINQTLVQAVDQETAQRRQALINQVKSWLADTTFIQITCDTKNQDSNTVFHITDRYPKFKGSTGFTFGIADFKPKLTHVSPSVKQPSYQPPVWPVLVNARVTSLVAVFTNLLDNALKYGSTPPQLSIHVLTKNRWVDIGFADNGIGIPVDYRTKIFDPFFRVPTGNVHTTKGYGLGLSYVRQTLLQHGGSIRVEANEPQGSLFWIRLPLG